MKTLRNFSLLDVDGINVYNTQIAIHYIGKVAPNITALSQSASHIGKFTGMYRNFVS